MKIVFKVLALSLPFISCNSATEEESSAISTDSSPQIISIVDSIGIEMGDSAYVFGAIADVEILPDGNIIVLDGTYCNMRIFSPDGQHLSTISGRGGAPGELTHPSSLLNWLDGTVGVVDPNNGGIHRFSLNGEWLGQDLAINHNIHIEPQIVSDSEFVSFKSRFDIDGEAVSITAMVSRFPISDQPLVTYWDKTVLWDPMNMGNLTLELFFSNFFATDPSTERVYVCPFDKDKYIINCFNADGSVYGIITEEYTPIPKTEEEIQKEKEFIAFTLSSGEGANPNLNYECDPWPNHLAVTGLYIGPEDYLWVKRGGTEVPTFDIWNEALEPAGRAIIPGIDGDGSNFKMVFGSDCIVAWDENPEFFQKIYILKIDSV